MGIGKTANDLLHHINQDMVEIEGFKGNRRKLVLTIILTVLTGGMLMILISWRSSIKFFLTHNKCPLHEAEKVLIKDIYQQVWEEDVYTEEIRTKGSKSPEKRRAFTNKSIKYVWDDETFQFEPINYLKDGTTCASFHELYHGLSSIEASAQKSLFGENFISITIASVWQLLIKEAYNPFYFFQAYTIIVWCLQWYFLYSGCIAGLSVISITLIVWETRKQSMSLRKTVTTQSMVSVYRDGELRQMSSRELVPGDVMQVEAQMGRLEADAVLLNGSAVTNEAMLTGESVPVTKVGVPLDQDLLFDPAFHRHHILYSGTQILQTRGASSLRAVVINTGFNTARGELVRSILFPKPMDFHFFSDFLRMIMIFLFLGVLCMGWSLYIWTSHKATLEETIFNSLDLITFVVPPILPATITAINIWSQRRLKNQNVFCLSSNYISLAGSVDVVCFDKTGTLTEGDLSVAGVVPAEAREFTQPISDLTQLPLEAPLTRALATCHNLTYINNTLAGYPLDIQLFTAIDWRLQEYGVDVNPNYGLVTPTIVRPQMSPDKMHVDPDACEMAVVKTLPFESRLQRMTVVTQRRGAANLDVYIKGAPETIARISKSKTIPDEFRMALDWYTRQGLRVVAVAWKPLEPAVKYDDLETMVRDELEENATFLGLVVMQNLLKKETPEALLTLELANIRSVMVTGDNLLTGIHIARHSGLISTGQQLIVVRAKYQSATQTAAQHLRVSFHDPDANISMFTSNNYMQVHNEEYVFAIDGESFEMIRKYDRELYQKLIHRGRVFARMKPDQKISVIEALQDLGHQVAMCGDGCNDCGALKAAHAGVSLSSAEASVAAPFTSRQEDIRCIPILIKEGRATLVSSFVCFKYNVACCFTALILVLFHFGIQTEPSDSQYLIMDLVLITIPALVLGDTGAYKDLVPKRPTKRILSTLPIVSILSFLGIQVFTFWFIMEYVKVQPWFIPFEFVPGTWPPDPSYENTSLVIVIFYIFVNAAIAFSLGAPFRAPLYTNYILTAYIIGATIFCIYTNFTNAEWITVFLNFKEVPSTEFLVNLLLTALTNLAVCYLWENWVLCKLLDDYILPRVSKILGPRLPFEKLEADLRNTPNWPPLENEDTGRDGLKVENGPIQDHYQTVEEIYEDLQAEEEEEPLLLFRKLTKKHQFRASVKYREKVPVQTATQVEPGDTGDQTCITPPPDSAGYQNPWSPGLQGDTHGTLPGKHDQTEEKSRFQFNQSIRGQIMKGTGGGFRTFKGSVKKENKIVDSVNHSTYSKEKAIDTGEDAEGFLEENSTKQDSDKEEQGYHTSPGYLEQRNLGSESLVDEIQKEWVRISTSSLKEVAKNAEKHADATCNATFNGLEEVQDSTTLLYDIPMPPRPVSFHQEMSDKFHSSDDKISDEVSKHMFQQKQEDEQQLQKESKHE
ncbi:polyamine-transporting ATPase 13A3-like isoform X2 [Oratosquilla oratoria]|uniref:polyamine-transporting ATPase 13A3-like isoform X2 n=1 Tax=Oratosquilla oratoria TaxID=337810 RepID=UPI003F768A90